MEKMWRRVSRTVLALLLAAAMTGESAAGGLATAYAVEEIDGQNSSAISTESEKEKPEGRAGRM